MSFLRLQFSGARLLRAPWSPSLLLVPLRPPPVLLRLLRLRLLRQAPVPRLHPPGPRQLVPRLHPPVLRLRLRRLLSVLRQRKTKTARGNVRHDVLLVTFLPVTSTTTGRRSS